MSRILKRPMFRIGGSVDDGIMSMAAPRKNYEDGSDYKTRIDELKKIYRESAGPGPSRYNDLGDMLISGGLNILSGKSAGKGTLGAVAESFKEPYAAFAKSGAGEDAFQRQLDLAAATQGVTSVDAERLARLKLKSENQNQELIELTKLLQLSGVQNPYAVAKTQIDFKRNFGEEIAPTPVNRDDKGKLSGRQLAGVSVGQAFLINDPKSGLITARKTDEAGNYKLIDPLTNKEKVPPAVTPPKTYSEILGQNPFSIRRNTLMQEYLKKQQEKKKNTSGMGD
jgi:hypothetical protein